MTQEQLIALMAAILKAGYKAGGLSMDDKHFVKAARLLAAEAQKVTV